MKTKIGVTHFQAKDHQGLFITTNSCQKQKEFSLKVTRGRIALQHLMSDFWLLELWHHKILLLKKLKVYFLYTAYGVGLWELLLLLLRSQPIRFLPENLTWRLGATSFPWQFLVFSQKAISWVKYLLNFNSQRAHAAFLLGLCSSFSNLLNFWLHDLQRPRKMKMPVPLLKHNCSIF